jgi:hypothetical protein
MSKTGPLRPVPEPYDIEWNARVKDRLENHLHAMVCSGETDLRAAQKAIASNWIAAYRRYVGPTPDGEPAQHVGPQLQRIELVKFSIAALHRKCGRTPLSTSDN